MHLSTLSTTPGEIYTWKRIEKDYASVVCSSAAIEPGATYTVSVNGSDTDVDAPTGGHGPMG
ncbi:hypothetical protein [Nocardioides dongkuii]|uniref:hypothetical protein n=1 Tax=Nocardioides dongkuii TaxID=2760089 RepID=UPI00187776EB|nr:hypothetical protein [Nocardioides dongkuii]